MDQHAVTVTDLHKRYGEVRAADGVSFDVATGEVFGLLGPNGAGKTTVVECILGLKQPDLGRITVLGMEHGTQASQIKARIGAQLQTTGLYPRLTVRELVDLFARLFPKAHPVDEVLALVSLEDRAKARSAELSGGQRQRLAVALALVNDPDLVFLDEPTTGLDPQARHLIWQRMRSLKKRGVTLILTTQYMEEAAQLCDRLVVMHQGRILKEGSPGELVRNEIGREVVEIRIEREEDEKLIARIGEEACGHERAGDTLYFYCRDGRKVMKRVLEFDLPNVLHRPATLEDVFLKLTGRSLIE
jgi:Nod factor-specific ABC transporter ATP-binding protein NodI